MIHYTTRSAISQAHRTYIRENLGNIRDYSLAEINNFLTKEEDHMNSLKYLENFRVDVYKNGVKKQSKKFRSMKEAEVFCDRLTNYGEGAKKGTNMAIYQIDKLLKAYLDGDWQYPVTSIYG